MFKYPEPVKSERAQLIDEIERWLVEWIEDNEIERWLVEWIEDNEFEACYVRAHLSDDSVEGEVFTGLNEIEIPPTLVFMLDQLRESDVQNKREWTTIRWNVKDLHSYYDSEIWTNINEED